MNYITGICRAYTDYVVHLDDDRELEKWNLPKGGDQHADYSTLKQCIAQYKGHFYAGGTTPNALSIISALGGQAAFIGKVANDAAGLKFQEAFKEQDVYFSKGHPSDTQFNSALTVIFISPNGERSILFDPGISNDVTSNDIVAASEHLSQTTIFFLGMICRNKDKLDVCDQAMSYLSNAKIALSIQSFADMNDQDIQSISNYTLEKADIIFGNEDEFNKFIKVNDFVNIGNVVAKFPNKTFVQTLGEQGALIYNGMTKAIIPSFPSKVVDTTGAGDAFAGGFLYGINSGYSFEQAGRIGAYCASIIIGQTGGRPRQKINLSEDIIKGVIK